ncbi:MAG: hypothetical protein BKP49_06625 [Treponema sp. CETP13]|nr:MAG: hypothetical protein BKP49_06625 [Treponema sp. CETP13]
MKEYAENLNAQAINLASKGLFKESIACFRKAIQLESSNYLLWFNLGITYRDSGNLKSAKKAMLEAYKLNPKDSDVIEALSLIYYNLDDIDSAFMYCATGIEENPQNARMWNNMGVFFFSKGDYKEASEVLETAVSLNPHYYDALYNLRDTYKELGNIAGSEECNLKLKSLSYNSSRRNKYV